MTYNTRSEATPSNVKGKIAKPSAVVSRTALTKQRGAVERWSAYVVLLVSFLGTIAAFNGGWVVLITGLLEGSNLFGIAIMSLLAILLQGGLTYLQWAYADDPRIAYTSRAIDTTFTVWGWGPLFVGGLAAAIAGFGVASPEYWAWGVLGLVSLAAAWYPESRLVD